MAEFVLLMWPVVMLWLFTKFDKQQALILSLLVGYLLLPQLITFQLPGIPGFDKHSIPAIVAAILLASKRHQITVAEPPRMDPIVKFLLAVFIFTPILTDLLNGDVLINGNTVRPGLTVISGIREVMGAYIDVLPLLLGYRYLHDYRGARMLCGYIVIAMLVYSIPMLIEVRFSPQINVWIYGYFQHDFLQTIRYGGYRPIVFLQHPLWVAVMVMTALLAAIALARNHRTRRNILIALYLGAIMVLCKSAGALILAAVFAPFVAFLRAKRVAMIGAGACIMMLMYPAIRSAGLVPTVTVSELTGSFSSDRQGSLGVRLINEDQLLQRAAEKPIFGWGSWGRNRIYSPEDGKDLSITDGTWIVVIGMWGWIGYLAMFGLLCGGCARLLWSRQRLSQTSLASAALCILLTVNLLDSIPNSSIRAITWILAGGIFSISIQPRRSGMLESNTIVTDARDAPRSKALTTHLPT